MNALNELIIKKLKDLRKERGFTQLQIAEFLAVDQSLISKMEKGERTISLDMAEKLSDLYGMTIAELQQNERCSCQEKIAFRCENITGEDLDTIAKINKIAVNLKKMKKLSGDA